MSIQYNSPPPVAWRYGGNQMKRWRTKANVSREELAEAANYSPDTIKSMEQGVRMPTPRVLRTSQVDSEQLHRLLEVSCLRNVMVQVLPFERVISDALMGPMVLLETRDHERFAFTEGPFVSELSTDPSIVSRVSERLSMIRAQALSPAESARFIERMVDE